MILHNFNNFLFESEKFTEGEKVSYRKEGSKHYGKNGIFTEINDEGKYRITLDDGTKLAADPKNVFKYEDPSAVVSKPEQVASDPSPTTPPVSANLSKFKFVLSKKLRDLLNDMKGSAIAGAILKAEKDNLETNISYVDYIEEKEKNDVLTYLPVNRISRNPDWIEGKGDIWSSKQRQEMKVGRIVNSIFQDAFKQTEIEQFVNDFKAGINKGFSNFKLVSGEEIRYYYLSDHYENNNRGSINSSCMRGKGAQKFFDIYCNNPEKCKLLILMSDIDKTKIKGRALVWFDLRKPTGKVYMDRIYCINDGADQKLYIDYAIKHGWLYKRVQSMGDVSYIDPTDNKTYFSSVAVQLKPVEYKQYPSIDTLSYYTPGTGRLASNPGNYISGYPRYQCNSTNGSAYKLDR